MLKIMEFKMHHSMSMIKRNAESTSENTPIKINVQCFWNKPVKYEYKIYRPPHGFIALKFLPPFRKPKNA